MRLLSFRLSIEINIQKYVILRPYIAQYVILRPYIAQYVILRSYIAQYVILRSYNYIVVIELIPVLHTSLEAVLQIELLKRIRRLISNTTVA